MLQVLRCSPFQQLSLVLACLIVVGVAGCGSDKPAPTVAAPKVPKGKLVTEKEAEEFGRQLEKAVAEGTQADFDKLLNMSELAENAVRGLDVSGDFMTGMKQGIGQGSVKLFNQLQQAVKGGGNYKFLRVRKQDGRYTALFRLAHPNMEGINYHEHSLVSKDGKVYSDDIYVFTSAEKMSTSMRRMIIPALAQQNKGILARLTSSDSSYIKHFSKVKDISTALQQKNGREALRIYNTMPQEMREGKVFLIFRIQAASLIEGGEQQYIAAITDFRRLYPKESCVDFLSLDYYAIRKETDKLLASLDRVDQSVGGDPYLALLKASFLVEANRLDDAEQATKKALKEDNSITNLHWILIAIYQKKKDYPKLLDAMIEFDQVETLVWDDLTTIKEYSGFVKSPQYKEWLDHMKKK